MGLSFGFIKLAEKEVDEFLVFGAKDLADHERVPDLSFLVY